MPVQQLSDSPSSVYPYDAMAQQGAEPGLWVHATVCVESEARHDVTCDAVLKQFHMGPPLGPIRDSADAAGCAQLTPGEERQIKTFLDDRQAEKKAERLRQRALGQRFDREAQYCVVPDAIPPTADFSLWRFSCVGFVLMAYREAGITLLQGPYPERTLEELKRFYPHQAESLDDEVTRRKVGLAEGDNWPVTLVGYLLHSLSRDASEIHGENAWPYTPQREDSHFPHQDVGTEVV